MARCIYDYVVQNFRKERPAKVWIYDSKSPRFVINALSNAIIGSNQKSLSTMDVLLALKDAIENNARIDPKKSASGSTT